MNKYIKKDFDQEILKGNFPFKDIITKYSRKPLNELYIQFEALPARPRVDLYIADKVDLKALDAERVAKITGSGNSTKHRDDFKRAVREFHEMDENKIEPQYWGRNINETLIIRNLIEVENKIKRLERHSRDKKNSTSSFISIAKETSSGVINLLDRLPFRDEILEEIANRKDGIGHLMGYLYNTRDRSHSEEDRERYSEDDKDRYLELKGMFDNQIRQAISKRTVKSKKTEPSLSSENGTVTVSSIFNDEYKDKSHEFLKIPSNDQISFNGRKPLIDENGEWTGTKQLIITFWHRLVKSHVVELDSNGEPKIKIGKATEILGQHFGIRAPKRKDGGKEGEEYKDIFTKLIDEVKESKDNTKTH